MMVKIDDLLKQLHDIAETAITNARFDIYNKKDDSAKLYTYDRIVFVVTKGVSKKDKGLITENSLTLIHYSSSYCSALGHLSVNRIITGSLDSIDRSLIREMFGELFLKTGRAKAIKEYIEQNDLNGPNYISLSDVLNEDRIKHIYYTLIAYSKIRIILQATDYLTIYFGQESDHLTNSLDDDAFRITLDYCDVKASGSLSVYGDRIKNLDDFKKFIEDKVEKWIYPELMNKLYKKTE